MQNLPLKAALAMVIALSGPVLAQTPAQTPKSSAKPTAPAPARPAAQTPAETAKSMTPAERTAIQSDLVWTSHFNGMVNGEVSDRMINAIKTFQKDRGAKQTGVLNPQERQQLAQAARKAQENVGWKIVTDPVAGMRLGLPTKLVSTYTGDTDGVRWGSPQGTVQVILARRKEAAPALAAAAQRESKEPGRKVEYSATRPDFFVLSGLQGLKKFYVRGQIKGDEIRTLTVLYDQATEGTMEPVVIAMSSAFNPFPAGAQAGPPPRRKVEYATGVVVGADGFIVTQREPMDDCLTTVVQGHGNADRIAEDKTHDLLLLRIYGARDLKPLAMAGAAAKPAVTVTGIADPQSQGGGAAITGVAASVAPNGNGEPALSPAPGLGFGGGAAVDGEGHFAGLAALKTVVVAGPPAAAPASQASLISADQVRAFLKANNVTAAEGSVADAKASVLRVICVRK